MNALGSITLSILLALVLGTPARWAALGVMGGVLYMTLGQAVDVFGLHIYPTRALTLAAFVRVLIRDEWSFRTLNVVDRALLVVYVYETLVFILHGNGSAVNAIGGLTDVVLAYFSFRGLIRSFEDLVWFLRALAVLLVPYVGMLYMESSTGNNPFSVIGGIAADDYRDGRPRCTGSFGHAAILGTFGASFIPLFIALSLRKSAHLIGLLGIGLCSAIVFFSNSGGPVTCLMVAVTGWLFWCVRRKMSAVRAVFAMILVALVLFMHAPLWYLPAKIAELTGGDGWHRSYLMDVALHHLDEWWLAGMSVLHTSDWFPYVVVTGGADIINYYLGFGIAAGVSAVVLFVFLLIRAFSQLGKALAATRVTLQVHAGREILLWALGVVLTVHVFNWFGIVYFDQYYVVFFMQLATTSTLSELCISSKQQTRALQSLSISHRQPSKA